MLRIMFIDDDSSSVQDAAELLDKTFSGLERLTKNFEEAMEHIGSFSPDVIVLDVWKGSIGDSDAESSEIYDIIWAKQFCPVIVYSADSVKVDEANGDEHPLVVGVIKGSDSDKRVLARVREFVPYIESVKKGAENIRIAFFKAMRDVAPDAFRNYEDEKQRADSILRASRRRVAALMDEPMPDDSQLAAWEQYLCPPVSSDPQLGDVLREAVGRSDDPNAFRLVLTPSCDMVASNGRTPKVRAILVAKCCSIERGLQRIGIYREFEDKLSKHPIFTQGYSGPIVLLPDLHGRIPVMAANLRSLELIPIEEVILGEDSTFCIVASIDSPFRELVSWAYLQISCRPGLPDRDIDSWRREVINAAES